MPFNVRTPANYDRTIAHPLLVVYAAAGNNRYETERLTGLTTEATARGFIIAYPDHLRLSLPVLEELATIPALVASKWCIDETRIYLTGQSDGGMAADAIAARREVRPQECGYDRGPRAIACFVERPLKNSSRLKPSFGVARPLITTIVRSRTAINARPLRSGRPFPAGTR